MNESLVIWIEARRGAEVLLKAHYRRHGLRLPASPALIRIQAQAHITPDLSAEAREAVSKFLIKETKPKG